MSTAARDAAHSAFAAAFGRYGADAAELQVARHVEDAQLDFRPAGDSTLPWEQWPVPSMM